MPARPTFIRFVIAQTDEASHRRLGVFHAARDLRENIETPEDDRARLFEIAGWFGQHLAKPARFARSRRSHPQRKAISWFKDSAKKHIAQARAMTAILDR